MHPKQQVLKGDLPALSSHRVPGSGGVEVRRHGSGPHPALRVHGRVHHRDARRLRWETHRAQHAVEARPTRESLWFFLSLGEMRQRSFITGLVQVVFALSSLGLSRANRRSSTCKRCEVCAFVILTGHT